MVWNDQGRFHRWRFCMVTILQGEDSITWRLSQSKEILQCLTHRNPRGNMGQQPWRCPWNPERYVSWMTCLRNIVEKICNQKWITWSKSSPPKKNTHAELRTFNPSIREHLLKGVPPDCTLFANNYENSSSTHRTSAVAIFKQRKHWNHGRLNVGEFPSPIEICVRCCVNRKWGKPFQKQPSQVRNPCFSLDTKEPPLSTYTFYTHKMLSTTFSMGASRPNLFVCFSTMFNPCSIPVPIWPHRLLNHFSFWGSNIHATTLASRHLWKYERWSLRIVLLSRPYQSPWWLLFIGTFDSRNDWCRDNRQPRCRRPCMRWQYRTTIYTSFCS